MDVLVIGGTLFIGRLLVQSLLKAGHDVTIMHRKPDHDLGEAVDNLQCDRNDPVAVTAALRDRKFDAVFDNVYDWERGTTAAQVEASAKAAAHPGLQRYVFISSVAAYGEGLDHQESDALAPDDHPDSYVRNKAMTERMLFRMHQRTGFPAVTMRPPYIYGPGNPFYREAFFWDRLRDGRPIIIPGDGRRLMQFVYVNDVVWCCMRALETPEAVGQAFNVANARPVTQCEAVDAMADAAGTKPEYVKIPRERILRAGGRPIRPPFYFAEYFDMPAITQVIAKTQQMLNFAPTGFDQGLKETYGWYEKHGGFPPPDYSLEDRLLSAR